MKKTPLLLAIGAGYVLGAKAGRERYEQIRAQAQKIARNPRVQDATQKAQEAVVTQASAAAAVAKEKVSGGTSSATDGADTEAPVQLAP